jgi:hypothetical protein
MAGGAAQGVGPEFKPQHCKKKFPVFLIYNVFITLEKKSFSRAQKALTVQETIH